MIETAAKMKSIELFINFSIMDLNRNILRRNSDLVRQADVERFNREWGDETWRDSLTESEPGLFSEMSEKKNNEEIANEYRTRLKDKAGFKYVPEPVPMYNSKGAVVYYLFCIT